MYKIKGQDCNIFVLLSSSVNAEFPTHLTHLLQQVQRLCQCIGQLTWEASFRTPALSSQLIYYNIMTVIQDKKGEPLIRNYYSY